MEIYVLAVAGFALAFDQHRTVLLNNHPYPNLPFTPFLFDIAAWIGGLAVLFLLIGGLFLGVWWWPLLAMIIGTATNFVGRNVVPISFRWITSIGATLFGFAATLILFR